MVNNTTPQADNASWLLIGTGGHAAVLIDVIRSRGDSIRGLICREPKQLGTFISGHPISILEDDFLTGESPADVFCLNAIGNRPTRADSGLKQRADIVARYHKTGVRFRSLISPHAIISPQATIHEGAQILHAAVIQPGVEIKEHSIINTAAVIEHNSRIGQYSHVAPGAVVCGGVSIGDYVHIGANATLLPGVVIGDGAVIGAGMVVKRNVAEKETVA